MDSIDREILYLLQEGLPLSSEPFALIAEKLGITPGEILSRLKLLREEGVIRRFGASLRPPKVGILANAMVAWKVPSGRVEAVGTALSRFPEVTHCYERRTVPGKWDYNLYTVVHGPNQETVRRLVARMAKKTGIKDFIILFSTKEFKRASAGRIT
ncbi:siroheme decarboxylase subunit beta [Candidatus Hecatella orcuttiae]|jgi:DNA-binding Lrp family transcriptional regulator|uniref:siroheme decarboxylase subunit beta n=1 Tax=Candidatus Hecatella orcuttiae TaxID=1935119 RepID=UPI002867EA3C|nr:siroheme decarboxylase subunit beta [Candidatus Hecatella orcuttiae]